MGYTHYWTLKSGDTKKFANAIALFNHCQQYLPKSTTLNKIVWFDTPKEVNGEKIYYTSKKVRRPIKLHGWDGTGEMVCNNSELCFNGDAKTGLDHETFRIALRNVGDWMFCKTAGKPYDTAVCVALLCFKEVFGEDFEVSSDGRMRSETNKTNIEPLWEKAYSVFDKALADYQK